MQSVFELALENSTREKVGVGGGVGYRTQLHTHKHTCTNQNGAMMCTSRDLKAMIVCVGAAFSRTDRSLMK